jgi:hypothetical protein
MGGAEKRYTLHLTPCAAVWLRINGPEALQV